MYETGSFEKYPHLLVARSGSSHGTDSAGAAMKALCVA
jgi:hypothetical protein